MRRFLFSSVVFLEALILSALILPALHLFAPSYAQQPAAPPVAPLTVHVDNFSEPELCAEKDNVYLSFRAPTNAPAIKSFAIEAVHPAYIGAIKTDHWAPDWTSCDMTHDPHFGANARRVTFWETPQFWLVGYTFPSFWRPGTVPVRVGDRTEQGLHLVQLWMRYRERAEEVLVFYPPDGYWRFRPLPFADLRWTAYGSSVLIGPVEVQERPIVAVSSIAFDPKTLTFHLAFAKGGAADVHVDSLDQEHIGVQVNFSGNLPQGAAFAALRSMYSHVLLSDTAEVTWRGVSAGGIGAGAAQNFWGEAKVLDFKGADVSELWARRTVMSRHNTSAPDFGFRDFSSANKPILPVVLPKEE